MEISSLQVGLDALFVLIGSLSGAMTVWYTLKGKVEIQRVILDNLVADMEDL